jgi:hypothetical protein
MNESTQTPTKSTSLANVGNAAVDSKYDWIFNTSVPISNVSQETDAFAYLKKAAMSVKSSSKSRSKQQP